MGINLNTCRWIQHCGCMWQEKVAASNIMLGKKESAWVKVAFPQGCFTLTGRKTTTMMILQASNASMTEKKMHTWRTIQGLGCMNLLKNVRSWRFPFCLHFRICRSFLTHSCFSCFNVIMRFVISGCSRYYGWSYGTCVANSNGNSTVSVGSRKWWVDWAKNQCVQDCDGSTSDSCGGLASVWDPLYDTSEACCSEKLSWKERDECVPI